MVEIDIPAIAVTVMVLAVVVMTGATVYDRMHPDRIRQEICTQKLGDGAEWINDSDGTLDCRAPNGTIVENVSIEIRSNTGEVSRYGGDNWPAENASENRSS